MSLKEILTKFRERPEVQLSPSLRDMIAKYLETLTELELLDMLRKQLEARRAAAEAEAEQAKARAEQARVQAASIPPQLAEKLKDMDWETVAKLRALMSSGSPADALLFWALVQGRNPRAEAQGVSDLVKAAAELARAVRGEGQTQTVLPWDKVLDLARELFATKVSAEIQALRQELQEVRKLAESAAAGKASDPLQELDRLAEFTKKLREVMPHTGEVNPEIERLRLDLERMRLDLEKWKFERELEFRKWLLEAREKQRLQRIQMQVLSRVVRSLSVPLAVFAGRGLRNVLRSAVQGRSTQQREVPRRRAIVCPACRHTFWVTEPPPDQVTCPHCGARLVRKAALQRQQAQAQQPQQREVEVKPQ